MSTLDSTSSSSAVPPRQIAMGDRWYGRDPQPTQAYLKSERMRIDRAAALAVWGQPGAFRHSAVYIYVRQVCLPDLMRIELQHSERLIRCDLFAGDLQRTRSFLMGVIGMDESARDRQPESHQPESHQPESTPTLGESADAATPIGIADPQIATLLNRVGRHHNGLGLSPWMHAYLGHIIASAPLCVLRDPAVSSTDIDDQTAQDYMSYMRQAWSMMGVPTMPPRDAARIGDERSAAWPGIDASLAVIHRTYEMHFGSEQTAEIWDRVASACPPVVESLMRDFVGRSRS